MKIEPKAITVRDLVADYHDDGESGVRGYAGRLDIRPPFQREYVYNHKQRDAVMETVRQGFPLNVMYWAVREDGTYEIIDGQQRTISIAQYVAEERYSIIWPGFGNLAFDNLQPDQQERILNYELQVYVCEGKPSEKLTWFKTINIAGVPLTDQELLNAIHAGPWVSDAKRYFSRTGGPAYEVGNKYVKGTPIRQDYLATAIKWIICEDQKLQAVKDVKERMVEDYMGAKRREKTAIDLWNHFRSVIDWTKAVFPNYRKIMKGVDWGGLYGCYKDKSLDPEALEDEVKSLLRDDHEVQRPAGIYPYLLTGEEKHLNLRRFTPAQKQRAFEKLEPAGVCPKCGKEGLDISDMEADHMTPWSKGGKTNDDNCQVLCRDCNLEKSDK